MYDSNYKNIGSKKRSANKYYIKHLDSSIEPLFNFVLLDIENKNFHTFSTKSIDFSSPKKLQLTTTHFTHPPVQHL